MKNVKYTPEYITQLATNQIFTFGSNTAGRHSLGAALTARKLFGARYGVGRGLTGQTYALPTKDFEIQTLPLHDIERNIKEYIDFAAKNPQLEFLTTAVATGLAGYTVEQIGPLFGKFPIPSNVILPFEFAKFVKDYDSTH